jgi:phospholipase/carboxylesterase
MTRTDLAGLTVEIVGKPDAPITVVLLHGFGAPGDDLVPMAEELDVPARFVFPVGPLEVYGADSRAWWLLDLAKLEIELAAGTPRDRRGEIPDGLHSARATVLRLLDQLAARYPLPPGGKLVLGGFSQGAMLALDVALHRDALVDGLILMSGTLVAEVEWAPRLARVANLPIIMSHGRRDPLLPFAIAEELRDRLKGAGARVDWHAFVGGHEIPPMVLDAISRWLRSSCR